MCYAAVQLFCQIQAVDGDILVAVRQQSTSGSRARQELDTAKYTISDLMKQIRDIQQKAQQSELMVQEICRDIKKLDMAKRHLTSTITALRRLSMLMNAVQQLQMAAERQQYSEAAHLLGAVQQLSAHFRSYIHIPRVAEIRGRVAALEKSLRLTSIREFELVGEDVRSPILLDRLRSCCQLITVLGPSARDELVDIVCRREMDVYTQIFSTLGETARLERTVNRYKWLLRRLEARKEYLSVFPESWQVPKLLCITFSSITKTQLAEILDLKADELRGQVENLLKSVEATNIFEEEMERKFKAGVAHGHDAHPATPTAESGDQPLNVRNEAAEAALARTTFCGAISSVFVPHLGVYVDQVEMELMWAMEQMVKTETWQPLSPDLPVLKSSNELTEAIGAEVRQCTTRVTRGSTLIDMAAAFKRVYCAYASHLVARLPKTASGAATGIPILGGSEWLVKLSDEDVDLICLVVSTAEHCGDMLTQLRRALASKLDPPDLVTEIDFSEEEEEFHSAVSRCLTALLLGLETKLETGLATMSRHSWATVEMAGDQSPYVGTMAAALASVGNRLRSSMPAAHFAFFCDKLLRSFVPRFTENIFRCRKISDAGCQQLRLDCEAVKGAMVGLSKVGSTDTVWLQSFAADVHAHFSRPEAILKVVGSPVSAMVDTFFELLPQGAPADFQRMAELKVLKRHEMVAVLDQYNKRLGKPVLKATEEAASPVR